MISRQIAINLLLNNIPGLMNKRLTNFWSGKFEEKEIQATVFKMGGSKAPSSDGFARYFFKPFGKSCARIL